MNTEGYSDGYLLPSLWPCAFACILSLCWWLLCWITGVNELSDTVVGGEEIKYFVNHTGNIMPKEERIVLFRPKASLIHTIGGDLIKDEMAGVIELVKNSYDADARNCIIRFHGTLSPEEGFIARTLEISDDGTGMTSDDIINKWMIPATESKQLNPKSKGGRRVLGNKGIGRFSAMRVGDHLKITTTSKETGETSVVSVDWSIFTQGDKFLDDLELGIPLSTEITKGRPQGTTVEIGALNDVWDEKRVDCLKTQLEVMISPFADDFNIKVELDGGRDFKRTLKIVYIEDPIPEDYFIRAEVSATGSTTIYYNRLVNPDFEENTLSITRQIDDILNPNSIKSGKKERYDCGKFVLEMKIWDADKELIDKKAADLSMSPREVKDHNEIRKGISVYRDGRGIRPYNDSSFDWLNLDKRRIDQPGVKIDSRKLRGRVFLSSEDNPNIQDKSSREGLKENNAYFQLKTTIINILRSVENDRYNYRVHYSRISNKEKNPKVNRERISNEIIFIIRSHTNNLEIEKEVRDKLSSISKSVEEEEEMLESQKIALHVMYGVGIMSTYIVHEESNLSNSINSAANNINRTIKGATSAGQLTVVGPKLIELTRDVDTLKTSNDKLMEMRKSLVTVTGKKPGKKKISVRKVYDQLESIFSIELRQKNISLTPVIKADQIVAHEGDVFIALFNVIGNSIYWVQTVNPPRQISFECYSSEEYWHIEIEDNGPGVSEEDAESIFDLNFTRKQDGMGIGLFLAKESMERTGGEILLKRTGPHALFEIKIKKPKGE